MRLPSFRIRTLMIVTSVIAVLLAVFGIEPGLILIWMLAIIAVPVLFSPKERRVRITLWILALHPAMAPFYLYATWLTAWCVLGHRPRPSLDDPKYISPIVDVTYAMTMLSWLSYPISLGASVLLICADFLVPRRTTIWALTVLPPVWIATILFLNWDPLGVLMWLMD